MSILTHTELITKIVGIGRDKTSFSLYRMAILSMMAGAFVSMGGILSIAVGYGFPEITAANPGLQKLLSGIMFPVGLFLIVLFGGELFTGNNAVLIPACSHRHYGPFTVLKNWITVWCFNFAGALVFTYLFVYLSGLTSNEPYKSAIITIAQNKAALPLIPAICKGIAANWCVCLAVWLCLMVNSLPAKMIACWVPVGAFVVLGYEHCIANMFFIPAGMLEGADVTVGEMFHNLIPVTIGNIIGGAMLVGMLFNHLHAPKINDKE